MREHAYISDEDKVIILCNLYSSFLFKVLIEKIIRKNRFFLFIQVLIVKIIGKNGFYIFIKVLIVKMLRKNISTFS